jgi:Fe-S-cluster containining protein
MNWTLLKAIIKAKRDGLLRLVPATGPIRLDCLANKCAMCCMTLGSPVVTPQEAEKIGYQSIVKDKHGLFVKSQHSVCCLLIDGFCSIYKDRPRGCREYPWYNIDGRLYYDSGCPGIKHDRDEHPDVADIQPFENFFPLTPRPLLWLIKKICVKR